MKHLLILIAIAFLGYSCECTDVEPTETPYLNTFFVQSISGNISPDPISCSEILNMNIIFSKPVDSSTIDFTENALLSGYEGGNLSFSVDGNKLIVVINDFFCQDGFCDLDLNLSSGESKGVRSQTGDVLDGNRDGIAGDDFEIMMTLF